MADSHSCCLHLPLPVAAASTFSGCPLAELTPILNNLMVEAVLAGNQVVEGVAPKVLAAANAIPKAEYESIETSVLNYSYNVSDALMEPVLLAEVEATYPGKHGWLALRCMMCFAARGVCCRNSSMQRQASAPCARHMMLLLQQICP